MTFDNENILIKEAHPRLTSSGDRDRFKELLRKRLIECGWRDQVRAMCRKFVKENNGPNNVTFDMLVNQVTPRARALVPDSIKRELINKIRENLHRQRNQ
ncbi:hypothetical protein O3G_MSEX003489 [Manduca sexta]|uniref:Enhancer of yellow 2 transcription factor n=1 Tax=Manduca sexta TaxID=7130 RepID=A0A921YS89_MANSE|nr:hypothetical protein O3G_MSEX003489 [Manduca sexta]